MFKFKPTIFILLVSLVQNGISAPTIDQNIFKKLVSAKSTTNVLVYMKNSTEPVLRNSRFQTFATRGDQLEGIASSLIEFAAVSQKNVLNLLQTEKRKKSATFSVEVLWLTNQIIINSVDLSTIEKLSAFEEILKIEAETFFKLDDTVHSHVKEDLGRRAVTAAEAEVQWGVKQIEAPAIWQEGNTGQGVHVATIDTGVRWTHEALRHSFIGEYGWFDPSNGTLVPYDDNGHGTHTVGTIVGSTRGVGVSPGSTWASCKACDANAWCSGSDFTRCLQWAACPTKADGTGRDCSKAPHIVSNSWSNAVGGEQFHYGSVNALRTAGIIPLFANGNSGPTCKSAESPGDFDNVIGVGATTSDNQLASFSSVGPTVLGGRMKPDIAAPGALVVSSYHLSDTSYGTMSGTSMATPHAAGLVALLLNENTNLSFDQVKSSLYAGAVATTPTGKTCGGIPDSQYPNNQVGYGRINAVRSVAAVRNL